MTRPILKLTGAVAACALTFAACGGTDSSVSPAAPTSAGTTATVTTTSTAPAVTTSGCGTAVRDLPTSIAYTSGRYQFTIATGSGCAWSARTDTTWADVSPGSGQGSATLTLNVSTNEVRNARTLNVSIAGQAYPVVQNAIGCSYSLGDTLFQATPNAETIVVRVNASPADCAWTASASESWISVRTPSGSGSRSLEFDLAPNTGSNVRNAYLLIAGLRVNISQQGRG